MTKEEYKEKLKQFNSTPKYRSEVKFLLRLMHPKEGEKILDYGCGLGNLVREICEEFQSDCFGHDIVNYREKDDAYLFRSAYHFKFDKIYFMHSIAHIPYIRQKLIDMKELLNLGAKIFIITPNRDYLDSLEENPDYKPDPTVVQHYYLDEWTHMLKDSGYEISIMGQLGESNLTPDAPNGININERIFIEARWTGK